MTDPHRIWRIKSTSPRRRLILAVNRKWSLDEVQALIEEAFALRFSDPAESLSLASSCLLMLEDQPNTDRLSDLRSFALAVIGNAHRIHGRFHLALTALDAAEDVRSEGSGDRKLAALLLEFRASLAESQRKIDEALSLLEDAARLREQADDQDGLAKILFKVGVVLGNVGRTREAIQPLVSALDVLRDRQLIVGALMSLAWCLADCGKPRQADRILHNSAPLLRNIRGALRVKLTWIQGRVHIGLGFSEKGIRLISEARDAYVKSSMPQEAALTTLDIALFHARAGETLSALREAARAEPLFRSLGSHVETAAACLMRAQNLETALKSLIRVVAMAGDRFNSGPQQNHLI